MFEFFPICPVCKEHSLIVKKDESYKKFFICSNDKCEVISLIITTTTK